MEQAEDSATYIIAPGTAFARAQNGFLADYNGWVEKAFDKRGLVTAPCSLAQWTLSAEPDLWYDLGSRRVAIPFGEVRWEQETSSSVKGSQRADTGPRDLSAAQAALRRTALMTTLRFIEALEPLLKAESGKRQDEWDRWWANLMHDLVENNGTFNGECLEVGAWWGRKR